MRRFQATRRNGFTLIEMLVVIFIIVLLIGILIPAVMKFRGKGVEARTRAEIAQLETGVAEFTQTYDCKYVPTAFILASNYNPTGNARFDNALADSRQYYSKVWSKAFLPGQPGMTPLPPNLPSQVNSQQPMYALMDGNQMMVFCLGGIGGSDTKAPFGNWNPDFQGSRYGFLNSPTNPFGYDANTKLWYGGSNGATNKGPFFDFDPKRVNAAGQYLDPYGFPYFYFSAKNGNDYGFFGSTYGPSGNQAPIVPGITAQGGYGPTFQQASPYIGPMNPFIGADGKYINSDKCQIISAGKDMKNGPGGNYNVSNVPPQYYAPFPGYDDIANFRPKLLGVNEQ